MSTIWQECQLFGDNTNFFTRNFEKLAKMSTTWQKYQLLRSYLTGSQAHPCECGRMVSAPTMVIWLELEVDEWVVGILVDENYAY